MRRKTNKLLGKIRTAYQYKRRSKKWRRRKGHRAAERAAKSLYDRHLREQEALNQQISWSQVRDQRNKIPKDLAAPQVFSFVHNTDEVLEYWEQVGRLFEQKENVFLNIDNVTQLTSDAVALMIANLKNPEFSNGCFFVGRAPRDRALAKVFTQSGFYKYVWSRGQFSVGQGNILHRETNHKVVPEIAVSTYQVGEKHTFGEALHFDELYEIMIECMSNTHNHASLNTKDPCRWWIYTYPAENNVTCYSFFDLGVGIFQSMRTKDFFTKFLRTVKYYRNIDFVPDLLAGRIQSRIDKDNEIRGKGIPEIVKHSKNDLFRAFYLITNDVKINLKTGEPEQLKHNFRGTFFYWEIEARV